MLLVCQQSWVGVYNPLLSSSPSPWPGFCHEPQTSGSLSSYIKPTCGMRGVFTTPTQSQGYLRWGVFSLLVEQAAVTQGLPPISCSSPQMCLQARDEKPFAWYCTECVSLANPDARAAASLSTCLYRINRICFSMSIKKEADLTKDQKLD